MALDFMKVSSRPCKGMLEVYPKFIVRNGGDLMIRAKDFYAVYDEKTGLWSTDEDTLIALIDKELDAFAKELAPRSDMPIRVMHLWDAETNMIDVWHKYCQKQRRDCYHNLDETLIFANMTPNKEDYASKQLKYSLEDGDITAYDKLVSTLYSPDERHKLEWCIGSVVSGDSKSIQKFAVLYGSGGTGKSTVLNIIADLFEGYTSVFDARALGNSNNEFALEAFKNNPLVAIQHDGDLSHIEDNTRLNSLVSHERMTVNEKFKGLYQSDFKAFLFMGTNKPVKITDSKSGLIRRLIDISPSGNKIPKTEYNKLLKEIRYEHGAIAKHCLDVYLSNPNAYDNYIPLNMMGASNDFFNFMLDNYFTFKEMESIRLTQAWDMYNKYCDEAKVPFPLSKMFFKEEFKTYWKSYEEKGNRIVYSGFKAERFEQNISSTEKKVISDWLIFKEQPSLLDDILASCLAQYAGDDEHPVHKWEKVKKVLSELDTTKLHYVMVPTSHIVLDFDIKDNGEKSLEKNIEAASKFPPTYAELSKSGKGIHLHYIYTGDTSKLATLIDENVEIKVFNGNSSLRRKLTKCNNIPVRTISSGLPLKEEKVINFEGVENEKHLRAIVAKHLRKEIVPNTKPSMDLLYNVIETAYKSGIPYDITDMRPAIMNFALSSSHQSDACLKIAMKIHYQSEDKTSVDIPCNDEKPIAFFDCEVFPNLFVVCYKEQDKPVIKMINPSPDDIRQLFDMYRLIGFNCRRYDNHILYARYIGYSNEQLYSLSQRIIGESKNAFFREAYNISYTDVYDYCSKKQSLKKWEIELGIFHKECEYPWDQPVPESGWFEVADYCANDVSATEETFKATQGDWQARLILAEWAEMVPNSTTNQLTAKIIFGDNDIHTDELQWRDMGDLSDASSDLYFNPDGTIDEYTVFDKQGRPLFPGYKFEMGHSLYRDEDPKEGGYVYAEPGTYTWIALLDIASMHPSSAIAENLFGKYTQNFADIKQLRVYIKHKDFDSARALVPERIVQYLEDETKADNLAQALKIAINAVYGLTSAKFINAFHDERNKDNIVAKRGALFMINLKHEVQNRGYTVVHIKTDSIKIANADMSIIRFVQDYGKMYKYIFEHEATYERMCLVNDAVYIARYATLEQVTKLYGEEYVNESKDCVKNNKKHGGEWTATGTQFAVPYVFKTLFSHEDIVFSDMCETKSVTSAMYLRDDDENLKFVGKVGSFCPVSTGGYDLLRMSSDKEGKPKYDNVVGCKGWKWKEAADVKDNCEETIDKNYYRNMVDDAVTSITEASALTNFDVSLFLSDYLYSTNQI